MCGGDPPAEAPTGHEACPIISKPDTKLFVGSTTPTVGRAAGVELEKLLL
jgi:hypothetical protein